jgi:Tfp pilus assembly protein PilO
MASKAAAAAAIAKNTPPPSPAVVKRDSKANNYIAIVAVASVLVVIICGFIVKALLGTIILDGKLIVHTNQAKNDLNTKLANIPVLINNYNSLGKNQQLLSHAIPTSPDFPALVSISEAMSADAGVSLTSVTPDVANSASSAAASPTLGTTPTSGGPVPVSPYEFDVDVTGNYSQIVQFFTNVQQSARPMKVVNTDISGDSTNLEVSATIQTYYQAPANTADQTETLK